MNSKFRCKAAIALIVFGGLLAGYSWESTAIPTADLTANPTSSKVGQTVIFSIEVGLASDPECDDAIWSLDFGDGNSVWGSTFSSQVTNEYEISGEYSAELTFKRYEYQGSPARGCLQELITDTQRMFVAPLDPLVVQINATPGAVQIGDPITFDVFGSSTDATCIPMFINNWDFGDGETANFGSSIEHTYSSGGTFTAAVTVSDVCGRTGSAQISVGVIAFSTPVPGDDDEAPVQTTTYTITVTDGANSVVPSNECLLDSNPGFRAPQQCFSIQVDMTDLFGADAGRVIIQQSAGGIMEFSALAPDSQDELRIRICAESDPGTCAAGGGDGENREHVVFHYQIITQSEQGMESLLDQLSDIEAALESEAPEILAVLERFASLSQWMSENPSEYADLIDFLAEHNELESGGAGSSFPSGWDWDVIRTASCGNAGNPVACASSTGLTWIVNTSASGLGT